MTSQIRSILAISIIAIVLAACSTTAGAPPASPEPTVQPTVQPSEEPEPTQPAEAPRVAAGTITVFEGAIGGPGGTIEEVLALGPSGEYPTLANGVLFRDTDGTVYLATSVSDVSAPSFEGPFLEVLNTQNDGPSWDMANAELLGLEEANGIVFRQNSQVGGYLEIN